METSEKTEQNGQPQQKAQMRQIGQLQQTAQMRQADERTDGPNDREEADNSNGKKRQAAETPGSDASESGR